MTIRFNNIVNIVHKYYLIAGLKINLVMHI